MLDAANVCVLGSPPVEPRDEQLVHSPPPGSTIRVVFRETPVLSVRTGKSTVAHGYVVVEPPSRSRQTRRAPRSRRASATCTSRTSSSNKSPPRRTGAAKGGDDDEDDDRLELELALSLLDAVCSESLRRGDMQAPEDAASAAWAETFAYAWQGAELDRLCPRCRSPWTVHPRSGQRWCDWCWLRTTLELSQRRKSA